MSDYQKLKDLFERFGIGYVEKAEVLKADTYDQEGSQVSHAKVDGYAHFYTEFDFEADGSFRKVGIWE